MGNGRRYICRDLLLLIERIWHFNQLIESNAPNIEIEYWHAIFYFQLEKWQTVEHRENT